MELQLYIKNTARCLVIVDHLSTQIQYHQCNTIIKCGTIFKSKLSKNYNNIQQDSGFQMINRAIYKPNKTIFLCMYPPYGYFYNTNQAMFDPFDQIF